VCADRRVRTRLLEQVKARLARDAACYRITDKLSGALVTPALPGIVSALRFVFDDVGGCTLRDVEPLAEWPSRAMMVARGAARLALELALHNGDAKLTNHLALAIVRDGATPVRRAAFRRLTEAELLERRADGWARVLAHLAGEPEALMGHIAPHPKNPPAVWVGVHFHDSTSGSEVRTVPAEIHHRSSGDRGYRVDAPQRSEMLRWAGKLAGRATVTVEWGLFGWGADGSDKCLGETRRMLPAGARAGRNCVEHLLRELEGRVRASGVLRLPTRRRLATHPEHVAIYLLRGLPGPPPRCGYGRLPPHGWRKTAEALCGTSLRTKYSDEHADREHAKVRAGYAAALRLIAAWRALAPPR